MTPEVDPVAEEARRRHQPDRLVPDDAGPPAADEGQRLGRITTSDPGRSSTARAAKRTYVAAKAGIVGFSRSLAREILAAQRDGRALQRDEEPEDLVGPTFFLASPDAGFITGQTINVDGGKFMP